jgi:membrane protease YdiL (CAAX protease family)
MAVPSIFQGRHLVTPDPNTTDSFVMTAFSFEAALGVAALAIGWAIGGDPLSTVPITADALDNHLLALLWGVVATVPPLMGMLLINRLSLRPFQEIREFVDEHVLPLFQPLSLFELGAISFAAGFGEELLFRGLLQAGIAERVDGPLGIVVALAVASVLFGVCHWLTPTYAVLATLAGAYFGVLFLLTGNLLAPLVAHALYDFLALVYLTRRSEGERT